MKIIGKIFVGCLVLCSLFFASCSSCSGNKDGKTAKADTIPTFCKADTTEVLKMAESYLEHLKNKEYDAAFDMLRNVQNDSISNLTADQRTQLMAQQKAFPVLDYKLESYKFINEYRVELTYSIEFFKKEKEDDPIQNTIRITFAPQRINATWYLTLMEKSVMTMVLQPVSTVQHS